MCENFFFFLPLFVLYLLNGCDLFNMSCFSQISLIATLNILCSNNLSLKYEITKIEHKKILYGPSKILKNISWSISICLKYFMTPTKTLHPPPPSYLVYGPLIVELGKPKLFSPSCSNVQFQCKQNRAIQLSLLITCLQSSIKLLSLLSFLDLLN